MTNSARSGAVQVGPQFHVVDHEAPGVAESHRSPPTVSADTLRGRICATGFPCQLAFSSIPGILTVESLYWPVWALHEAAPSGFPKTLAGLWALPLLFSQFLSIQPLQGSQRTQHRDTMSHETPLAGIVQCVLRQAPTEDVITMGWCGLVLGMIVFGVGIVVTSWIVEALRCVAS